MYALLRGSFAPAHNAWSGKQIADQVSLRFQVVGVQPHGGLEFAMSLVGQGYRGKGAESVCFLGLAAIGLPEPVVIIGALGLESDGAFQAGNGTGIVTQLIETTAEPVAQRRLWL